LILLSVSLFTFFAWYFSARAEDRRKRAIQQAMDETAGVALMNGPDSRRDPSQQHPAV
jgi:putrescine transport system permease protein